MFEAKEIISQNNPTFASPFVDLDLGKIERKMKKVVLAYSGGLDTSYCVKYLINELQLEVHSVLVNTGGFSEEELKTVEAKAYEMGVTSHTHKDILETYYTKAIKFMVFGNVLKNNTYPLSVSAERIYQAISLAEYAKSIGAKYIAVLDSLYGEKNG